MPIVSNWISKYKVCSVESVEEKAGSTKGSKPLKICKVNIGTENTLKIITVVTSAPNVREKSRLVVAPIGSTVLSPAGEGEVVKKTNIGGVNSEGMFCDSRMLGWEGGSIGIAVQIDETVAMIGDPPPAFKPRPLNREDSITLPESKVEGLFAKKLTKEEKKKLSEEKRKARKAAKEAKKKAQEAEAAAAKKEAEDEAKAKKDEIP